MHLFMKSRRVNWETAYKNKSMLSTLVPAAGISVEPVCISAKESKKNMHMSIRSHFLSLFPGQLCGDYLVHIFFLHITVCFHSFIHSCRICQTFIELTYLSDLSLLSHNFQFL